jgi:hypothetical protein
MKLKRLVLLAAALLFSGLAIAQTTLPPFITGIDELDRSQIDHIGIVRLARNETLTATAGGTLANSAVLNRGMNIATTVVTTNDSFTLPLLTGSIQISIVNNGAQVLKVWPDASTGQIDTAGAGVGKTLAVNKMMVLTKGADGLWYSLTSP